MARYGIAEGGDRPAPKVGCVVVTKAGKVVAGYRGEIEPNEHAEFTVLEKKMPNDVLAGATVYTTLEPCVDRTPPKQSCADRLIARRVSRVVIGYMDPDHRGRGYHKLREAGISVAVFPDDLVAEIEELNRRFIASRLNSKAKPAETPPVSQVMQPSLEHPADRPHNPALKDSLAHLLKLALVELGWRQKQLVNESGIGQPRLSKLMAGQARPTDAEVASLIAVPEIGSFLRANIHSNTTKSRSTVARQSFFINQEVISTSRLTSGAWTPDGNGVFVGGFDGHVYRIDPAKGNASAKVSSRVLRSLNFLKDSMIAIATDDDGNIFAVNFDEQPRHVSIAHAGAAVFASVPIRANARLLTADRNGCVIEWSFAKAPVTDISTVDRLIKARVVHKHAGAAFGVAYSDSDGRYYSVGADGVLSCTSRNTSDSWRIELTRSALFSISIADSGERIACSSASGEIYLLLNGGTHTLSGHADTVRSIDFSAAGRWLLSGSKDSTVRLWNIETRNVSILLSAGDYIYTVKFSPDGRRALVVDGTGTLHIVNFPAQIDELGDVDLDAWLSGNPRRSTKL